MFPVQECKNVCTYKNDVKIKTGMFISPYITMCTPCLYKSNHQLFVTAEIWPNQQTTFLKSTWHKVQGYAITLPREIPVATNN